MRLWGGGWAHPGGEVFIGANGCVGHAGRLAMLAIEPLTQMKGCKGRGEGQMRDSAVSITACRRVRRRAVSRSSPASRRQRPREAQADEGISGPKSLGPSGLLCFLASRQPEGAGGAPCSSPIPTCPRRPCPRCGSTSRVRQTKKRQTSSLLPPEGMDPGPPRHFSCKSGTFENAGSCRDADHGPPAAGPAAPSRERGVGPAMPPMWQYFSRLQEMGRARDRKVNATGRLQGSHTR